VQTLPFEKVCNALLPAAGPSALADLLGAKSGVAHADGLWVGGKVKATPLELTFEPNRLNAALNDGSLTVRIPMAGIRSVRREFGWLSGIVVVDHGLGQFRFRCFGARRVARILSQVTGRRA